MKKIVSFFNILFFGIIDDIKFIIKTVSKGEKGQEIMEERTGKVIKELRGGWGKYFKENWGVLLLFAGFFFVGLWVGSQYYQQVCNTFILENFGDRSINNTLNQGINIVLNI